MLRKTVLLLLLSPLLCSAVATDDLVVIVSSKLVLEPLRADQVSDIFLAKVGRFPSGAEATPVDLGVGSPQRDQFYEKVSGKSPAWVRAYWSKMIFTGRGQPPRELANGVALRKLIAEHPGMIGYIDRSMLDDSVRVVLTP